MESRFGCALCWLTVFALAAKTGEIPTEGFRLYGMIILLMVLAVGFWTTEDRVKKED